MKRATIWRNPGIFLATVLKTLTLLAPTLWKRARPYQRTQYIPAMVECILQMPSRCDGQPSYFSHQPQCDPSFTSPCESVEVEKDHVYSVLDPRVQYDVTISRIGIPPTHLTVTRPVGAPPIIPKQPTMDQPPHLNRVPKYRKSGRSSGRSSNNGKNPRPKSLQAYDNPKYLDHLFPSTAEI